MNTTTNTYDNCLQLKMKNTQLKEKLREYKEENLQLRLQIEETELKLNQQKKHFEDELTQLKTTI